MQYRQDCAEIVLHARFNWILPVFYDNDTMYECPPRSYTMYYYFLSCFLSNGNRGKIHTIYIYIHRVVTRILLCYTHVYILKTQ
jgi:hypothetical protein